MCICGVCVGNCVGGIVGGGVGDGGSGGGGGSCGGSGGGGSCVSGGVSVKSLKKGRFLRRGDAKLPKNNSLSNRRESHINIPFDTLVFACFFILHIYEKSCEN